MEKLYLIKNKTYFNHKDRDLPLVILLLILGMGFTAIYYSYFKNSLNKTFMCFIIYLISFVYYRWKQKDIEHFMNKGIKYQSEHSAKCFSCYKKMMKAHLLFLIIQLLFVIIDSSGEYINAWLLVYILLIGYTLMNYNCVIFFCEDGYFTGSYYIPYTEISDITCIKEKVTQNGLLYICRLEKNGEIIGYDRFVSYDYIVLKDKIMNKNSLEQRNFDPEQ